MEIQAPIKSKIIILSPIKKKKKKDYYIILIKDQPYISLLVIMHPFSNFYTLQQYRCNKISTYGICSMMFTLYYRPKTPIHFCVCWVCMWLFGELKCFFFFFWV